MTFPGLLFNFWPPTTPLGPLWGGMGVKKILDFLGSFPRLLNFWPPKTPLGWAGSNIFGLEWFPDQSGMPNLAVRRGDPTQRKRGDPTQRKDQTNALLVCNHRMIQEALFSVELKTWMLATTSVKSELTVNINCILLHTEMQTYWNKYLNRILFNVNGY